MSDFDKILKKSGFLYLENNISADQIMCNDEELILASVICAAL